MSLEENRFQDAKHKKKAQRILKDVLHEPERAGDKKTVGIEAGVHSRRCSCSLCKRTRRNPWFKSGSKLTVQEQRAILNSTLDEND